MPSCFFHARLPDAWDGKLESARYGIYPADVYKSPQPHDFRGVRTILMPESHERILRRIIRRFSTFPTTTYSNRIPSDVNVCITYEERSGRVLNLDIT